MAYAPAERTDLSALHLHDRHTPLGLSSAEVVAMWRTILLTRRLDQKIWALNRMGKAPFAVSCQGHEGAQVGSAWAIRGTEPRDPGAPGCPPETSSCPITGTPA
jgi:TPP-dependent pyruvate/acetoin dehydrogenase alpha subunit